MLTPDPNDRFAALAAGRDDEIDLGLGALLVAAQAYPTLDVSTYLQKLEELADAARASQTDATSGREAALALLRFLFHERGFVGNRDDYYDRRNSYLNEVLDRRTGIPISLTVLHIEVARRLGIRLDGVSFPGHFLAKFVGDKEVILDPFSGEALGEQACAERLQAMFGPEARFDRNQLRSATKKEILARMLGNLKQIHLRDGELEAALTCSQRILQLVPDAVQELRDRGLLYERLECYAAAQSDLERFLEVAPAHDTADTVRRRLLSIRKQASSIH